MAKMKTDINNNLTNKGNSKGFNKGSEPTQYGPDSVGGGSPAYTNTIGAVPDPNGDKNKVYEKRMITPMDPVLNAVAMPNKKGKMVNKGTLSYWGDESGDTAPANNTIGGTPKPNNIR